MYRRPQLRRVGGYGELWNSTLFTHLQNRSNELASLILDSLCALAERHTSFETARQTTECRMKTTRIVEAFDVFEHCLFVFGPGSMGSNSESQGREKRPTKCESMSTSCPCQGEDMISIARTEAKPTRYPTGHISRTSSSNLKLFNR